jgi:hypothetical protein
MLPRAATHLTLRSYRFQNGNCCSRRDRRHLPVRGPAAAATRPLASRSIPLPPRMRVAPQHGELQGERDCTG